MTSEKRKKNGRENIKIKFLVLYRAALLIAIATHPSPHSWSPLDVEAKKKLGNPVPFGWLLSTGF
jgi:hypothetical protein